MNSVAVEIAPSVALRESVRVFTPNTKFVPLDANGRFQEKVLIPIFLLLLMMTFLCYFSIIYVFIVYSKLYIDVDSWFFD